MAKKLAQFDPVKLARYERNNYVYYYQRRWTRLLLVSILMVKEAYGLSLFQAIYGAYLIARAEMAFAPHPDNNLPLAEAYLRRFYIMIRKVHHLDFELEDAASRELNWWIVHRRLFAVEQNGELARALASLLVTVYCLDPHAAMLSARFRARGMLLSDRWVRSGMNPASPLLDKEEEMLCQGYTVLKSALTTAS